jgi:FtsZ-interacting cell division protein ZipA
MLIQWLVGIIAILALVFIVAGDFWVGKSKHSTYYKKVQTPTGKGERVANIPDSSKHDAFYSKLNTR